MGRYSLKPKKGAGIPKRGGLIVPQSALQSQEKTLDAALESIILPAAWGLFRDYVEFTKELPDIEDEKVLDGIFFKCLQISNRWNQYSQAWKADKIEELMAEGKTAEETPEEPAVRKVVTE